MVRKTLLLIGLLAGISYGDTGYKNTIKVTETDNSPVCTAGQLKFQPGQVTCNGQTATLNITGGGGGASSLAVTVGVVRSSPTSDVMFNPAQFSGSISGSTITISSLGSSGVSVYPATNTIQGIVGISATTGTFVNTGHPVYIGNPDTAGPYETGLDFGFNGINNGSIISRNYADTSPKTFSFPLILKTAGTEVLTANADAFGNRWVSVGAKSAVSTFTVVGDASIGSTPAFPPVNGLYVQGSIKNAALGTSSNVCTDGSGQLTTSGCTSGSGGVSVYPATSTIIATAGGISASTGAYSQEVTMSSIGVNTTNVSSYRMNIYDSAGTTMFGNKYLINVRDRGQIGYRYYNGGSTKGFILNSPDTLIASIAGSDVLTVESSRITAPTDLSLAGKLCVGASCGMQSTSNALIQGGIAVGYAPGSDPGAPTNGIITAGQIKSESVLPSSFTALSITGLLNQACIGTDSSGKIQAGTCGGSSGGASTLAVGTGTTSGYVGAITSSPTAIVLLDSETFKSSLQGGATAFIGLLSSSVTLQGNSINLSNLQTQTNNIGLSTGTIQTQVNNIAVATGTIQTQVNSVALATGTIQTQVNNIAVATGTIQTQVNNIAVATGTIQTQANSIGVSTGTLLTQINTKVNFSSFSATQPIIYNSGTGVFSATPISLSTGVIGLLPVANGGTGTASPGLVQGANITISGTWPNQTIAASAGGGGGGSSLAVTTGAVSGFGIPVSSPTSAIVFDSSTFNVTLTGSATAFVSLNSSPQMWTSAGTGAQEWDKPTGAKIIEVLICGGGGSGGGGSGAAAGSVRSGGGGGGGGFCAHNTFLASTFGSSVTVTIGGGGASRAGGTGAAGTDGSAGTSSTFETWLTGYGGGGGGSNAAGAGGGAGGGGMAVGGSATTTTGATGGACGAAGAGANTGSSTCAGAGGGTATTAAASGGVSYFSGAGGGAATTTGVVGLSLGGSSVFSAAGGGCGGGVNAASPGTAQNGANGGSTGGSVTAAGGGGTGGSGNGGNGSDGDSTKAGKGGAGGASSNSTTGFIGGNGGIPGGGGGGGGGGTNVGGASGAGGDGKAWVWTYF